MSIIAIWSARHRPAAARRRRALWRLMLMLRRDEQVRPRPPVTLPGSPRSVNGNGNGNGGAPTEVSCPAAAASPPPAASRVRDCGEIGRRADRFEKAKTRASEPGDQRDGDWTRAQLERMDAQFRRRLAWAIGRGLE